MRFWRSSTTTLKRRNETGCARWSATPSARRWGAVGARLWYPDGRLQHGGVASHAFHRFPPQPIAPMNRAFVSAQNTSAITAACMVTRKDIFSDLDGFDENLPGNFNDVDFCLRLREGGWLIVWTPYANLIHHESATRGHDTHARDREGLFRDASYMEKKCSAQILRDPYYTSFARF